jgi:hypothetical protein
MATGGTIGDPAFSGVWYPEKTRKQRENFVQRTDYNDKVEETTYGRTTNLRTQARITSAEELLNGSTQLFGTMDYFVEDNAANLPEQVTYDSWSSEMLSSVLITFDTNGVAVLKEEYIKKEPFVQQGAPYTRSKSKAESTK